MSGGGWLPLSLPPPHLEVLHWVPVMFDEDDCVCSSQTEAKAPNMGREEEKVNGWVGVEAEKGGTNGEKVAKLIHQ